MLFEEQRIRRYCLSLRRVSRRCSALTSTAVASRSNRRALTASFVSQAAVVKVEVQSLGWIHSASLPRLHRIPRAIVAFAISIAALDLLSVLNEASHTLHTFSNAPKVMIVPLSTFPCSWNYEDDDVRAFLVLYHRAETCRLTRERALSVTSSSLVGTFDLGLHEIKFFRNKWFDSFAEYSDSYWEQSASELKEDEK